jgi:hypothetical protein
VGAQGTCRLWRGSLTRSEEDVGRSMGSDVTARRNPVARPRCSNDEVGENIRCFGWLRAVSPVSGGQLDAQAYGGRAQLDEVQSASVGEDGRAGDGQAQPGASALARGRRSFEQAIPHLGRNVGR